LPRKGRGDRKGNRKLDIYSDAIQVTCLPGDHWRLRHDFIKHVIFCLCIWAGVHVNMEVFNLFSGLLCQQGLSRIDSNRDRQAMVPDFKITLTLRGLATPTLHKLKVISSSMGRYKVTQDKRGVDKRAEQLHDEYLVKARGADVKFGGESAGEVGRVEQKLVSFPRVTGLVFGQWGEASEAVYVLVDQLATSRAKVAEPQAKRKGKNLSKEGVKSQAVGYIRRRLSVATVRAQKISLLGRLEVFGPGLTTASGRRRAAMEQEEMWKRERAAHQLAARQGFNALRRGFAKLD
jgi:hypothetical protein